MARSLFRKTAFLLSIVLPTAFFFFADAGGAQARESRRKAVYVYENFLDIPGITEEEAEAVGRLRRERASFVFGVPRSTECFVRRDGNLDGFTVLLCDWLSRLFGIPFEPALFEWDELLDSLASGEVDFTGDLTSTPERLKTYWMTTPIAKRPIKYMMLSGGRSLAEIAKSRPVRYAFLEETTTYDQAKPSLDGAFEVHYGENDHQVYRKLKNGEVDALIDEGPAEAAFDAYGDVVAKDLLPPLYSPVSLATRTPELAPVISVVQKALDGGIYSYLAELYAQGYESYIRNKFFTQLTPEEAEYVRAHGENGAPVKFAARHDSYPAVFYNAKEKAWQGCALDVLAEVEELSGLRFVQVHRDILPWPEIQRMLEAGEIDLVGEFVETGRGDGLLIHPDIPYMTDQYALISRSDMPDFTINDVLDAKVGLVRDSSYAGLFRRWFPGHMGMVEYADASEATDALERGEIDLFMGTKNLLLGLTRYMEKPHFKVDIAFEKTYGSFFGVDKDETVLCSILSKSLSLIDVEFIANRWRSRVFGYQWVLDRARAPWLIGASVLTMLVAALLLILFFKTREAGKKLELTVLERTKELENQTVAAQAASEAKSNFLARMSHEMRTPMNVIIGMGELALREDISPPSVAAYISGIGQAGHNLLSIINDVLDFSKIESGLLQLEDAPYRMASVLDDVINVIRARAAEQRLLFLVDVDPKVPDALRGDAARLRQVLMNLLGNAVKYTQEGFIRLTADAASAGADKNSVVLRFEVSDSGIGIKPEDMQNLFRDFVRLDMKRNSGIEGTGLGLSITRRLCQAMGGDVSVTSVYGEGSEFVVTLPQVCLSAEPIACVDGRKKFEVLLYHSRARYAESVARTLESLGVAFRRVADSSEFLRELEAGGWSHVFASAPEAETARGILKNASSSVKAVLLMDIGEPFPASGISTLAMPTWVVPVANVLKGKAVFVREKPAGVRFIAPKARVLIVDDIATNLQVAIGLLAPYRVKMETCMSGAEAVELVREEEYDVVFMDYMMPGMDGIEAVRRIRALDGERFGRLPIVALTASAMFNMRAMFLEKGFSDFLAKPIEIPKLNEIMEHWIPPEKKEKKKGAEEKAEIGEDSAGKGVNLS
ncbi:MAG: transporter substrate-binding domain-containing protein [Synergistaceae bacterium]|jgi:signal transduction histidine kinase/CheY-like chemotaxis protein|nr:transporter substrate-binding domain-containing protein [Synergistaceae bacterium]